VFKNSEKFNVKRVLCLVSAPEVFESNLLHDSALNENAGH
jgi:hypothetical protein